MKKTGREPVCTDSIRRFDSGQERTDHLFALLSGGDMQLFKKVADGTPFIRVARDKNGNFLLHRAARIGSLPACNYLLRRGMPATCPGSRGVTPLHIAASRGDAAVMKTLLSAARAGHSPVNANGMTPLHVAAGEGLLEILKMLIKAGADSAALDKFDRLPLHYAAGADRLEVVECLMARDRKPMEQPDAFGQRPIHWAMMFECVRTANWLICNGADLKAKDIYGRTALGVCGLPNEAVQAQHLGPARIKKVLQPDNLRRLTYLQRQIVCEDIKEVRRRLRTPESMQQRGPLGRTPLHLAAFARNRELLLWMLENGGDAKIQDDYAWSPMKLLS